MLATVTAHLFNMSEDHDYNSSVSDKLLFWNKQSVATPTPRSQTRIQPVMGTTELSSHKTVEDNHDNSSTESSSNITSTTTTVQYLNTPSRSKVSFSMNDTPVAATTTKQPTTKVSTVVPIPPPPPPLHNLKVQDENNNCISRIRGLEVMTAITATYWGSFLLIVGTMFILGFVLSQPAGLINDGGDNGRNGTASDLFSNHTSKRVFGSSDGGTFPLNTFDQTFRPLDGLRHDVKPLPSVRDAESAMTAFHDLKYPKAICSFCDYSHMNVTLSEYVRLTSVMYHNDDTDLMCSHHFTQSPFQGSDLTAASKHPYSKYPYTTSKDGNIALNMCGLSHTLVVDADGNAKPFYGHLSFKLIEGHSERQQYARPTIAQYIPNDVIIADLRFLNGEQIGQPAECQLWHLFHLPPAPSPFELQHGGSADAARWDKHAYSYFDWTLEGNEVFTLSSEVDATNHQEYEKRRSNDPYWSFGRWVKESVGKQPAISVWNIRRDFYEYWNTTHTAAEIYAAVSGKFIMQAILLVPMTGYDVSMLALESIEGYSEKDYHYTHNEEEFPIPLPPIIRVSEREAFVPVHVTFDESEFKSWTIPNNGRISADYTLEFHPRSTNLNHQHTLDDNSMELFYWKCRTAMYDMLTQSSRFYKFG